MATKVKRNYVKSPVETPTKIQEPPKKTVLEAAVEKANAAVTATIETPKPKTIVKEVKEEKPLRSQTGRSDVAPSPPVKKTGESKFLQNFFYILLAFAVGLVTMYAILDSKITRLENDVISLDRNVNELVEMRQDWDREKIDIERKTTEMVDEFNYQLGEQMDSIMHLSNELVRTRAALSSSRSEINAKSKQVNDLARALNYERSERMKALELTQKAKALADQYRLENQQLETKLIAAAVLIGRIKNGNIPVDSLRTKSFEAWINSWNNPVEVTDSVDSQLVLP